MLSTALNLQSHTGVKHVSITNKDLRKKYVNPLETGSTLWYGE